MNESLVGILAPVAFLAFQESFIPFLACGMMQLTLKYGLTPWSTYSLSLFGLCMTSTGDLQDAFHHGSLALKMMERVGEDARTLVVVYGFIHHTQRHVVDAFNPTLRAYFISFARGDLAFSGQAISIHICARMIAGSSLEHIIEDTLCFANQLKSYNQSLVWQILVIFQRSNLELANRSSEIVKLLGDVPNDDSFQASLKGPHAEYHTFVLSTFAMRSQFILNNQKSAMESARKCWRSKGFKGSILYCSTYFFFSALIALECWKSAGVTKRFYFWHMFKKFQRRLISWTEKGNPNTLHLVVLLKAEMMIAERKKSFETVQTTYRQCMAQATRLGFLHDTALAKELFGRYCLNEGKKEEASYYLQRSKLFYNDWGALKKVNCMKLQYGDLVENSILTHDLSKSITGRPRQEIVEEIESVRARTVFGLDNSSF
jgi:histidine kinase